MIWLLCCSVVGWLVGVLMGLAGRLADEWLVGRLVSCLFGLVGSQMCGWLVGLAGWLTDVWLVGRLVSCLFGLVGSQIGGWLVGL